MLVKVCLNSYRRHLLLKEYIGCNSPKYYPFISKAHQSRSKDLWFGLYKGHNYASESVIPE